MGEEILQDTREKDQVTYTGKPIRLKPDFLLEAPDIPQAWKKHRCQPELPYSAKLSITIDEEIKSVHNKNKFKQCLSTNPALQKALEGKKNLKNIQEDTKDK